MSDDTTIYDLVRSISQDINAAIAHLTPKTEEEEPKATIAYARFVSSVFSLLVATLPSASRYDLYELLDVGVAIARQAAESESLN